MMVFFAVFPILILLSPSENTRDSAATNSASRWCAILAARSVEAGPAITDTSGNISEDMEKVLISILLETHFVYNTQNTKIAILSKNFICIFIISRESSFFGLCIQFPPDLILPVKF